jgi:hypothetical protein
VLLAINNFRSKTESIADADSYGKTVVTNKELLIMTEVPGKIPSLCVMVFHVSSIKRLTIPMIFIAIMKPML